MSLYIFQLSKKKKITASRKIRSKVDGSNCLESFSNEKIPGGFQGFKSHFPHIPMRRKMAYTQSLPGFYEKMNARKTD